MLVLKGAMSPIFVVNLKRQNTFLSVKGNQKLMVQFCFLKKLHYTVVH